MRVLGEEATMDPTAIEQQVRQQMEERSQVRERPCSTSQCVSQYIESSCRAPAPSHGCTCTYSSYCGGLCDVLIRAALTRKGLAEHSDLASRRHLTVTEPVSTLAEPVLLQ
jgi:pre-mRNA processing factor 3 (PRP3)